MTYDISFRQGSDIAWEQTWVCPSGFGSADLPLSTEFLPAELGKIEIIDHPLRRGMAVVEYKARLNAPVIFSVGVLSDEPYLWLPVILSGMGGFQHGSRFSGEGSAEVTNLGLSYEPWTELEHRPGELLCSVDLLLTAGRLREMLQGQRVPPGIEGFMAGRFDPVASPIRTTASLRRVAGQIQHNPYQGSMAAIYLEGKVYELLAETLRLLADREEPCGRRSAARRSALAARDIMMADLGNPPRIEDVARQVGLSQRHLTDMFRELFEETPLQCLTRWRLEQARALLAEGELSVKQVAYRMGYAHVSSFSQAYSRCFGAPPGSRQGKSS